MFEISKILKRSWQILWDYKVLWIFGFLLALTGSSGGSGGHGTGYSGNMGDMGQNMRNHAGWPGQFGNQAWAREFGAWATQNLSRFFDTQAHIFQSIVWIAVIILAVCLVIGLILALVRYPAETAVIRMVDEHETSGMKVSFKQGWKLGWNRRAFRIWLIDLIIGAPILLICLGFAALVGVSIFNVVKYNGYAPAIGAMIGSLLLVILLFLPFLLLFVLAGVVRQYIIRFAALEDIGVWESFAKGWKFFTKNFKNTLLIWLVLIGVGIAAGLAMMLAVIILVPAYVILAIPGAIVAAIPAAIGYGITSLFSTMVWPWVIAALVGLPFFFTVAFAPVYLLSGWINLFGSSVWTLTFRQLKMMAMLPPEVPVPPTVN